MDMEMGQELDKLILPECKIVIVNSQTADKVSVAHIGPGVYITITINLQNSLTCFFYWLINLHHRILQHISYS